MEEGKAHEGSCLDCKFMVEDACDRIGVWMLCLNGV